jgi:hypothetical protein
MKPQSPARRPSKICAQKRHAAAVPVGKFFIHRRIAVRKKDDFVKSVWISSASLPRHPLSYPQTRSRRTCVGFGLQASIVAVSS